MKKTFFISFVFIPLLWGCTNRNDSGQNVKLTGVGATFSQTFYDIIIDNYLKDTGNKVTYNDIGSGAGIRAFHDKVADFIVTDTFLSDEEIAEYGLEVLHIPCSLGAIVLAFNIQGIDELNLSPKLISDIYLRKITHWNDPSIADINPGIKLPDQLITLVFRSEGSGSTYLFSNYLSRTCHEWEKEIGVGKSLKLCEGIAVKGNSAIANTIKNLSGSIGYVSMEHASLLNLTTAAIQNSAGNFVKANKQSLCYIAQTKFPDDMRIVLTDPVDEENAYPIPCLSWLLVYKNQSYNHRGFEKYKSLVSFLNYIICPQTQKIAGRLTYSPLPSTAIEKAQKLINSIEWTE